MVINKRLEFLLDFPIRGQGDEVDVPVLGGACKYLSLEVNLLVLAIAVLQRAHIILALLIAVRVEECDFGFLAFESTHRKTELDFNYFLLLVVLSLRKRGGVEELGMRFYSNLGVRREALSVATLHLLHRFIDEFLGFKLEISRGCVRFYYVMEDRDVLYDKRQVSSFWESAKGEVEPALLLPDAVPAFTVRSSRHLVLNAMTYYT